MTNTTISILQEASPTEIYTLSLHDALPIFRLAAKRTGERRAAVPDRVPGALFAGPGSHARCGARCAGNARSEEHTSELQSHVNLVCRLLLEKKNHYYRKQHFFSATAGFV